MSPSLKALLALIFVAVMGAILIRPILDAVEAPLVTVPDDGSSPAPKKSKKKASPEARPSPAATESPTAEPGAISGAFRTQPLFDRYPRACLRASSGTRQPSLIAAVTPAGVRFGTTAGPTGPGPRGGTRTGPVEGLFGFNQAGDLYAYSTGAGAVVSAPEGLQGADGDAGLGSVSQVVWSPTTTCGVAIGRQGALLVLPYDGSTRLVREGVRSVAFSPDGRRLAILLEEGRTSSVWVADLPGTTMREVQRQETGPGLSLEGWSPDANSVYLTFGPDSGLSFVTVDDPPLGGGIVAVPVTGLEQCGDRLLGIVNGAVARITKRGPDYLTQTHAGYKMASCSPDGGFIAAIRSGRLVLLDRQGGLVRALVTDSGYRDVFVDWGPRGAGLLFGRLASGAKTAQVWHIAEGGAARNTGLTYRHGPGAIDWSATPPTGAPSR